MSNADILDQLAYIDDYASQSGYNDIEELCRTNPELLDDIAANYREEHPIDGYIRY